MRDAHPEAEAVTPADRLRAIAEDVALLRDTGALVQSMCAPLLMDCTRARLRSLDGYDAQRALADAVRVLINTARAVEAMRDACGRVGGSLDGVEP